MKKYEAIIWDCDGVLIDSEVLACTLSAEMISEAGYPISLESFFEEFLGKGLAQILTDLDKGAAATLSSALKNVDRSKLWARQKQSFTDHLKPIEGIEGVLESISVPMAVASGSEVERLRVSLGLTDLTRFFGGHVYSAEMVENGKPAPDVFLLAAEKLGVAPEKCLVVEDGIAGIRAAKAAGMDVVAYLGGSHMSDGLKSKVIAEDPDSSFYDIREVLPLLSSKNNSNKIRCQPLN